MSTSTIELSHAALQQNINFIRSKIGTTTKISAVVKGNAYGHGIENIVPLCEAAGIDTFSVFSSDEARRVYAVKEKSSEIYIMGHILPDDREWVIDHHIQFSIHDIYILHETLKYTIKSKNILKIHLEVETGMNRTGLSKDSLQEAVKLIGENKTYFQLMGVSTHLAGAESIANHVRIKNQIKIFRKRIHYLKGKNMLPERFHCTCSAGMINYPEYQMDMVRVGVMLYGYWSTKETYIRYITKHKLREDPLIRVIKWKTNIMTIRHIRESEFIGYGLAYQAQLEMKIAIIPVGYSDGFSRQLSNNGHVLVQGQRADIIGYVNMNMTIVDITHISNVQVGDEVVLIGKQEDNEISFASFAEMNNNLNYELLTRLSERISQKVI